MMMLVLAVCSFEGTWNIDRNEKQCESTVFFAITSIERNVLRYQIDRYNNQLDVF